MKSRTFQFPVCQWAGAQEHWGEHGQDSWSEQAKGTFHTIEHHAWCINWGELFGSHHLLLRYGLGTGQQALRNCIVCHLFLLGFIPLFLFVILFLITIIIIFYFISIIKLFSLNRWVIFFWFSSSSHWQRLARDCLVHTCLLALNHNTHSFLLLLHLFWDFSTLTWCFLLHPQLCQCIFHLNKSS